MVTIPLRLIRAAYLGGREVQGVVSKQRTQLKLGRWCAKRVHEFMTTACVPQAGAIRFHSASAFVAWCLICLIWHYDEALALKLDHTKNYNGVKESRGSRKLSFDADLYKAAVSLAERIGYPSKRDFFEDAASRGLDGWARCPPEGVAWPCCSWHLSAEKWLQHVPYGSYDLNAPLFSQPSDGRPMGRFWAAAPKILSAKERSK